MGNEESRIRSEDKKYKSLYDEEIEDSYFSEKQENKIHRRMSSSHSSSYKRSKKSNEVSRSWSRSSGRGRRAMSQSPKRSQSKHKMEEIETTSRELYCKDCNCYSSGKISWNQHIVGRRHAKNTGRETPELSNKTKLIETTAKKRLHDFVSKRKTDNVCNKKFKLSDNVSKNLMESDHEDYNYVGLDYILVIHKHGKSIFQCYLCNSFKIYENSQHLKDHVLGKDHQRAYEKEKHKSSIKIKRLKSRNPGKHSLEELVEQKLFSSNKAERNAKKLTDIPRDSRPDNDRKSSKMNYLSASTSNKSKPNIFLRKTIEEVQLHNRRYELKMASTTFLPERKLSTPASESVFSTNSTPSRCTTASPGCGSTLSFSSFNDIAPLGNTITSPTPSSESAQTPGLLELVETLSINDICKLLLLKLKNVEIQQQDLEFLHEVANEISTLSKNFKKRLDSALHQKNVEIQKQGIPFLEEVADETIAFSRNNEKQLDSTLQKENLDLQKASVPLFIEVSNHCNSAKNIAAVQSTTLHAERIDEQPIDEALNLSSSGNKNSSGSEMSPIVLEESCTASTIAEELNQPIQPPAAFWERLPSTQDLDNILSSLPSLNHSKNSDGVVEIQLD